MTGKYERTDGTRFTVIKGKKGLERGDDKEIGRNILFSPITEVQLQKELDEKLIKKV